MTASAPLKISYCTTCRGRLHHLQRTLPANMALERDNPQVEFVVLDYGSEDGTGAWIRQHYAKELESGRLRYARTEAPHFEMAHAKNMAHRLATGDVLCNLDADNFLAPGYSAWLAETFRDHTDSITNHGAITTRLKGAFEGKSLKDTRGRIALTRENFERLHGYNEKFSHYIGGDNDLTQRALDAGLKRADVPMRLFGDTIAHTNAERVAHLSTRDKQVSQERLNWSPLERRMQRAMHRLEAAPEVNEGGTVGCGTVHVNFAKDATLIAPLEAQLYASETAPAPLPTDWATSVSWANASHSRVTRG